jgi:hypothetical protein
MSELSGKRIRYALGASEGDEVLLGADDVVTVVPWDCDLPPIHGIGVGYCNLLDQSESYKFDEDGGTGDYGPYLPPTETSRDYKEGRINPAGAGWKKNLEDQFRRRRARGFLFVELDNWDAYGVADVADAISVAFRFGLAVLAKNPGTLIEQGKDPTDLVRRCEGIIAEEGAGSLTSMATLRREADKDDDFPVFFVSFGKDDSWARGIASDITVQKNISVTHDFSDDEYGGKNVVDVKLPTTASKQTEPKVMAEPKHLVFAKSLQGRIVDGPKVPVLAAEIGAAFPEMMEYAREATAATSWCGIFIAWVLFKCYGTRPPFGARDVLRWMYVDAFEDTPWGAELVPIDQARPGDVVVLHDPHHITFLDHREGDVLFCIGGNQSDGVKISQFSIDGVRSVRRPPTIDAVAIPIDVSKVPPELRPLIRLSDFGPFVSEAQRLLGIRQSGTFDNETHNATMMFQASRGLGVDGEIGEETWPALASDKPAVPSSGAVLGVMLSPELVARIAALAGSSPLASHDWADRGRAPLGYTKGMCEAYAKCYLELAAAGSAATTMAAAPSGRQEDVLTWYAPEIGRPPSGIASLRSLFTIMFGLGMMESSGQYNEGRDQSVPMSEQTADTAEAGLFQQSWDSHGASPEIPKLLRTYSASAFDGFVAVFREGVPSEPEETVGSGTGADFQRLAKRKPAFAVEVAAVGLRFMGGPNGHWGPIRRKDVEVSPDADSLLRSIEMLVEASVTAGRKPPTEPDVFIPPSRGGPMPDQPTQTTGTDPIVEGILNRLRPILEQEVAKVRASMGDVRQQMMDSIVVALGGKVPPRVLLPGTTAPPLADTVGTSAPTTTAPAKKGPLADTPSWMINGASAISTFLGSIAATQAGVQGDAFSAAPTITSLVTTFGLPILSLIGGASPTVKTAATLGMGALRAIGKIFPRDPAPEKTT